MRPRTLAKAAAVLAVFALLASCTGEGDPTSSSSPSRSEPTDRPGRVANLSEPSHPLGSKWDWSQPSSVAAARKMRGGSTFFEVERCFVEKQPGRYDWRRVDTVVNRSERIGYALMLKIRAGSCGTKDVEQGARDKTEAQRKSPSALPDDMDAYQKYVRALVQRYSARGVHWYGIENEIDTANFWSGSYSDFSTLAKETAKTVRSADQDARLHDPGLSSTAYGAVLAADLVAKGKDDEAVRTYQKYYERRLAGDASRFPKVDDAAGLRGVLKGELGSRAVDAAKAITALDRDGVFDVYQLHFYENVAMLPDVLAWVRTRIPERMPVEAWEAGVAWPADDYDENTQAEETAKLTATLLGSGVERVVYLPLAITPKEGKKQVFRGLYEPKGAILPAGQTFRQLTIMLADDPEVEQVKASGLDGMAVSKGKQTELVVWSGGGKDVERKKGVKVRSFTGRSVKAKNGSVRIGAAPTFLTWPAPIDEAQQALGD